MDSATLTTPCFTSKVDQVARELVGPCYWPGQCITPHLEKRGKSPYIDSLIPVIAYPRPGEKRFEVSWPGGFHIDGIQFASLWPQKMVLVGLIYLTDTSEYGGATAVIPGSHRRIFGHWAQQEELPEKPLHRQLPGVLENPSPVPVNGQAGDMIFMHHLLAHSGSPNRDDHVRLALNANFAVHPDRPYLPKSGLPQPDWTPLDWTLRTDNLARPLLPEG